MSYQSRGFKGLLTAVWLTIALSAPASSAEPAAVPSSGSAVPAPPTPLGSGPYRAIMEVEPGLPTHTVYHPADLGAAGRLPLVVWGNGACANAGDRFRWFLSDIASYGYLVIAVGPIANRSQWPEQPMEPLPAGATPAIRPGDPAQLPPPVTHSAQLLDAVSWAATENERAGSPFHHRLDVSAVAAMGQSCGGAQALEASADPRIRTTIMWNSGLFPGVTTMAGGGPLTKSSLRKVHGSIAYISGDEEDLAFGNANDDFEGIDHVPVFRAFARGVLHEGTYRQRNGGEFAGIAVGWLNWQLRGDRQAARLFVGAQCGLCVNPHWVVHSKNLH
jgi:dienelactone hydrolase